MAVVSRGVQGRRPQPGAGLVPPGQYLVDDFPVLSAGPTPHVALEHWDFTVVDESGAVLARWGWDEFRALPVEEVTVDIHCVTKWSKPVEPCDMHADCQQVGNTAEASQPAFDVGSTVDLTQFTFSFSIFILAMVVLGGLGSIWGVVVDAIILSAINHHLCPGSSTASPSLWGWTSTCRDLVRHRWLPAGDHHALATGRAAAGTAPRDDLEARGAPAREDR